MIITRANIGQSYSARGLYPLVGEETKTSKRTERVYPNHHEELDTASKSGTGTSQVNDPYKLLDRYPDRREVLEPLLREIQRRIEKYDPRSSKGLDLQGIDFRGFNYLRDVKGLLLNIDRLLIAMGANKGLQYPLVGANLTGADLSEAYSFNEKDGQKITGEPLKELLLKNGAKISENTRF